LPLMLPDSEQSHSASVNPSAKQFSANTGPECQSTTTLTPSQESNTGAAPCFALAVHANQAAMPENNLALPIPAGSGRKLSESFPRRGPIGAFLKILLASTVWASTECCLNWKVSATKQRRRLKFRLVPSMRRINGQDFGLLPTPIRRDWKDTPNMAITRERERERERAGTEPDSTRCQGFSSGFMAYTDRQRTQVQTQRTEPAKQMPRSTIPNWQDSVAVQCSDGKIRRISSRICGVGNGIPDRMDRIKSLGNSIVPQVAFEILQAIAQIELTAQEASSLP